MQLYKDDIEEGITNELIQFKEFSKEFIVGNNKSEDGNNDSYKKTKKRDKVEMKISFETKMYNLLIEKKLQDVFPDIYILLGMYLVLMTSNSTDERSFSRLKLLKSHLRSTMNQNPLSHLTILSLESDLLRQLSFDGIISNFAEKNTRKVFM